MTTLGWDTHTHPATRRRLTCPGTGQRTRRPASYSSDEPDRCPACGRIACGRIAYVRVDGTTGAHYR